MDEKRRAIEECVERLVECVCDELAVPKVLPAAVISLARQVNSNKTARRFVRCVCTYDVRLVVSRKWSELEICGLVQRVRDNIVAMLGVDVQEVEYYWSLADVREVRVAKFKVEL